MKGVIPLYSMRNICVEGKDDYKGLYVLSLKTIDRIYLLKASNEFEMRIWLVLIDHLINSNRLSASKGKIPKSVEVDDIEICL